MFYGCYFEKESLPSPLLDSKHLLSTLWFFFCPQHYHLHHENRLFIIRDAVEYSRQRLITVNKLMMMERQWLTRKSLLPSVGNNWSSTSLSFPCVSNFTLSGINRNCLDFMMPGKIVDIHQSFSCGMRVRELFHSFTNFSHISVELKIMKSVLDVSNELSVQMALYLTVYALNWFCRRTRWELIRCRTLVIIPCLLSWVKCTTTGEMSELDGAEKEINSWESIFRPPSMRSLSKRSTVTSHKNLLSSFFWHISLPLSFPKLQNNWTFFWL